MCVRVGVTLLYLYVCLPNHYVVACFFDAFDDIYVYGFGAAGFCLLSAVVIALLGGSLFYSQRPAMYDVCGITMHTVLHTETSIVCWSASEIAVRLDL